MRIALNILLHFFQKWIWILFSFYKRDMPLRIILTLIVGLISGFLGGALGIGGIMIVPCLLLFGVITDYKMAVGTTLLAMLPPISILAVMNYNNRKKIDYLVAAMLCISFIIGARYGAIVNKIYAEKDLKYLSAAIFFITGFYFLRAGYYV
jgi:hypothetical protein